MNTSLPSDGMASTGSRSRELHVSGRNKGIREIDLNFALAEPGASSADDSGISAENAMLLAVITSLDLSRNEIEFLSHLEALSALRRLDVSYNLITSVRGLPFTLTRLNLSHNRLRSLNGIASLPHLKELDVSSNRLSDLGGLSHRMPLQLLRADDNRLVSTYGLEDMPSLRVLLLANNFIEGLDELAFLPGAVSLQALTLRNNPIAQIGGYRPLVGERQPSLLTLDGVPILRPEWEAGVASSHPRRALTDSRRTATSKAPKRIATATTTAAPVSPPQAHSRWAAPNASRASASTSARVTPVRRADPPSGAAPAESPLFDDSFMRTVYGGPAQRSMGRGGHHPYDGTRAGSSPVTTGLNTSVGGEDGTPVAERQPPQPTRRADRSTIGMAAVRNPLKYGDTTIVPDSADDHDDGRGSRSSGGDSSGGLGSPRPNTTTESAVRRPSQSSYARQFEEVRAVFAGKQRGAANDTTTASSPAGGIARSRHSCSPVGGRSLLHESTTTTVSSATNSPGTRHLLMDLSAEAGDRRSPAARLHDCLVASEQLARENQQLKARGRRQETQLAEARRIVSEQLADLSATRLERDALRRSEGELTERAERARRHAKAMDAHHREELAALLERGERAKTFYEAQLADLRRQLAAEVARSTTLVGQTNSMRLVARQQQQSLLEQEGTAGVPAALSIPPSLAHMHQHHQQQHHNHQQWRPEPRPLSAALPPFPRSPAADTRPAGGPADEGELSPAATPAHPTVDTGALASQLKGWLYAQMADDMDRAEYEELQRRLLLSLEADEAAAGGGQGAATTSSVPPVPVDTERTRELLEAYILQQQQQEAASEVVAAPEAVAVPPSDADAPQAAPATRSPDRLSPVTEPFVSRARPSLSPQKD